MDAVQVELDEAALDVVVDVWVEVVDTVELAFVVVEVARVVLTPADEEEEPLDPVEPGRQVNFTDGTDVP